MSNTKFILLTSIGILLSNSAVPAQQESNWVDAEVQQFAKDGAWCWFQDERSVIDTIKNKLLVSSANMQASVDVATFDLENMRYEGSKRFNRFTSPKNYSDDHNSPAVVVAPNGNYIALWAHHYDARHHYSIYNNGNWSSERTIEWGDWSGGQSYDVAYSNPYYLSEEDRIYNFSRVFNVRSPHFIFSDDNGESWEFGGMLTTHELEDTYNRGYYKYWGNGVDRIDMCFTEEHPRDYTTSLYHGYIKGHKLYDSFGKVTDEDIYDGENVPSFGSFTKVFAHGTDVNGVEMGRCWQYDIATYDDGIVVILFKARANDEIDDHRNFYARFDGEEWKYTYIGKAGKHIYGNEHDNVGLGSVNPNDPNRIYICSAYNPGDDDAAPANKREIWRGISKDEGDTWEWEPVTANSTQDNFRPIVPKWKPGKEAVQWFRGSYQNAPQMYAEVIGTFYEYEYIPPVSAKPKKSVANQSNLTIALSFSVSDYRVTINYHLPEASPVTLKVFSLSGKRVLTLVSSVKRAGNHRFNWNTGSIPAGSYLVHLSVGESSYLERVSVQR